MDIACVIMGLIVMLCAGALYTGWRYEREQRLNAETEIFTLREELKKVSGDLIYYRLENAREKGIGIGRQCDALQRQLIEGMKEGGVAFSIGKHTHKGTANENGSDN